MPVWMGCEDHLVNALQVCQNKAARLVTKLDRFTSTKVLMQQCGWLSVKQLMIYHSLVLLHKVFKNQKPVFLYQKTAGSPLPNTRQATATTVALTALGVHSQPSVPSTDLSLARKSWCWSSVSLYSELPPSLVSERKERTFKTRLKDWVSQNVEDWTDMD